MAKARKYVFTPARRAALAKATAASAKKRKLSAGAKAKKHAKSVGNAAIGGALWGGPGGAAAAAGHKAGAIAVSSTRRRIKAAGKKHIPASVTTPHARRAGRGVGISGLRRNTIPYARVNKRSSTIGVNAGTIIPGTSKRIVVGGYGRIESTNKHTAVDKAIAGRKAKVIPVGSRRHKVAGKAHSFLSAHGLTKNPALRGNIAGSQARLGTSRKGGPTVIVRRGSHRTMQSKSRAGIQRYDRRMATIAGRKASKPRPQRRKAAKKKKRR